MPTQVSVTAENANPEFGARVIAENLPDGDARVIAQNIQAATGETVTLTPLTDAGDGYVLDVDATQEVGGGATELSEIEPEEDAPTDAPEGSLEEMTVAALKEFAEKNGLDVNLGLKKKDELVAAIKKALGESE